jgi:hypothetical protein
MLIQLVKSPLFRKLIFLLAALLIIIKSFAQQNNSNAAQTYKFITLAEAEKVLDGKAHVKDSTWKNSGGLTRFLTTIVTNVADKKTGQNRRLFFSYEQYPNENAAKEIYASLKAENEKTLTVSPLAGTGDEAFWVNDAVGNPFMMIRESNKIFKLKMYYVTEKNAFERLITLAKRLIADN